MLDKLIISKQNGDDTRKVRGLLVSTSIIVTLTLITAMVGSLFSQNLSMGQEDLNISTLIAPPTLPEEVPPSPETTKPEVSNKTNIQKEIVRKENILRIEEAPRIVPTSVSTTPLRSMTRPRSPFKLGKIDRGSDNVLSGTSPDRGCSVNCGGGIGDTGRKETRGPITTPVKNTVPPLPPSPAKPIVKSGGVVNGLAKNLVTPGYPSAARALRITGKVTVQVLISEEGDVLSAHAVDGHPLLRPAAVRAAQSSKFTSTTLSKIPVKVRGLIIYNFRP